jgi:hypothetical protein
MTEIFILVLIVAVIAFLVVMARRPPKQRHARSHKHSHTGQQAHKPRTKRDELNKLRANKHFWGVEIHQPGCAEATKLTGKQFPLESAPELPVEGCVAAQCSCIYIGVKDRRALRRRLTHERRDELRFEPEKSDRRSHKDRRKSIEKWRNRD